MKQQSESERQNIYVGVGVMNNKRMKMNRHEVGAVAEWWPRLSFYWSRTEDSCASAEQNGGAHARAG